MIHNQHQPASLSGNGLRLFPPLEAEATNGANQTPPNDGHEAAQDGLHDGLHNELVDELSDGLGQLGELSGESDLETILAAWHGATVRLQATHESLREEVRRLSDELEIKNRELARQNRLADLGRMATHVAHEVRNCLVPMTLYVSMLRRGISSGDRNFEIVRKIEAGFAALEATVSDLLQFTADRAPVWRTVDLRELTMEVVEGLAPQFESQGIDLELDIPFGLRATADRDMLRRAILNLILNAVDAMPEGGDLVVTGCRARGVCELEVADSGSGLDESIRRRLFEPFFTTKSGGTGLGLAIVQRIIEAHGGSILAANCPEGGAAFTLRIPERRALEAAA